MKNKMIKSLSILFVLLMLCVAFVPVAMAQADKKVQKDTELMQKILEQKSNAIQNKYDVSKVSYSESDLKDLNDLVILLLDEQGISITNLDVSGLEKYSNADNVILSGSISFKAGKELHEIDLFTHSDFKNSTVEMFSKDGINYNSIKMNKVSESEDVIEYNIEQKIVRNSVIETVNNTISYPTANILEYSNIVTDSDITSDDMSAYVTRSGIVYPPSSPPPGIGATVVSRVQFSLLVDASTVVGVIANFIPGAQPVAFLSAAVSIMDIILRRGLNVDTDRTYARIKIVSPAITQSYVAPWPAIGVGVRAMQNSPLFGYYLEITEYYIK